jgi:hypothetical protein
MKISTPMVIEIKTQDLTPYTTKFFSMSWLNSIPENAHPELPPWSVQQIIFMVDHLMWMKHCPTTIFDTKVSSISTYSFVFYQAKLHHQHHLVIR